MANGQQIAKQNLNKFLAWTQERKIANDWQDYLHRGKLHRTLIASECNFAKSVLQQNPSVKEALSLLEGELASANLIQPSTPTPARSKPSMPPFPSTDPNSTKFERRVKELEEKNILLKIENDHLRQSLKQYEMIEDNMLRSGLLPKL